MPNKGETAKYTITLSGITTSDIVECYAYFSDSANGNVIEKFSYNTKSGYTEMETVSTTSLRIYPSGDSTAELTGSIALIEVRVDYTDADNPTGVSKKIIRAKALGFADNSIKNE